MEKLSREELTEKLKLYKHMILEINELNHIKNNELLTLIKENTELRNEIAKLQREKKV